LAEKILQFVAATFLAGHDMTVTIQKRLIDKTSEGLLLGLSRPMGRSFFRPDEKVF
jgi:hypothetical protein